MKYDVLGGNAEFREFGNISNIKISYISKSLLPLQTAEVTTQLPISAESKSNTSSTTVLPMSGR
jgi:hypothetical protein